MTKHYEIYFFGLICHVGDSHFTKKHAAIVNGTPEHVPCVWIDGHANKKYEINKGEDITFTPNTQAADLTEEVDRLLPHLEALVDGGTVNLQPNVLEKKTDGSVIAYVDYAASNDEPGTLEVADIYRKHGAKHVLGGTTKRRGCVARLIVLTLETDDLHIHWGTHDEAVENWVLIFNSAHQPSDNDFSRYLAITQANEICVVEREASNCGGGGTAGDYRVEVLAKIKELAEHKIVIDADEVECANSHWP